MRWSAKEAAQHAHDDLAKIDCWQLSTTSQSIAARRPHGLNLSSYRDRLALLRPSTRVHQARRDLLPAHTGLRSRSGLSHSHDFLVRIIEFEKPQAIWHDRGDIVTFLVAAARRTE